MKTVLSGVLAALALAVLPAVHAEDSSVNVPAPKTAHRYYMSSAEFRDFSNKYQLENGQVIRFTSRLSTALMYAQVDDGKFVRIYATSPTTFVSDSGARFAFRDQADTVAISDFQTLPMAAQAPANQIMMARR